jgi:predicted esterase
MLGNISSIIRRLSLVIVESGSSLPIGEEPEFKAQIIYRRMLMRKLAGIAAVCTMGLALATFSGCTFTDGNAMEKDINASMPPNTGFICKELTTEDGHSRKYSVFIPHDYTPTKKWPLIMFLHGMGEGGGDGVKCVTVGLGPEIEKRANDFEFIAIFPQSGDGSWDENGDAARDAMGALHQVEKDYSCDTNCVALTGLSHGGYGTWAIGAKYVNEFSALAPMCSDSDYKDVETLAKVPQITAYSFTSDPFVNSGNSTGMVDAINKAGGHARAEIYDGFGHAVWHTVYGSDDFYAWILSSRRPGPSADNTTGAVKTNQPG